MSIVSLYAARMLLVTALLTGLVLPAQAASIAVSPLRLDMKPGQQMTALTVSNTGKTPVLVQGQVQAWLDSDKPYAPGNSGGMMLSPPLFKLAPGGKQLVRIGWQQQTATPDNELAFRVFLQEVPDGTDTNSGLRVTLRLSVPLFAQPSSTEINAVSWQWQSADDGSILRLQNTGNRHERISRLKVTDAMQRVLMDGPRLLYILPGQTQAVNLPDRNVMLPLNISTVSDRGTEQYILTKPAS
ncbi:MAG: molecular chaperone [Pseudomonadota bacterium]